MKATSNPDFFKIKKRDMIVSICPFADFKIINQWNFMTPKSINIKSSQKKPAGKAHWLRAALTGDLAKVQSCIEDGIDIDSTEPDGRSALMNAAGGGHYKCVELLLTHRASHSQKSRGGHDALNYALGPDFAGLFIPNENSNIQKSVTLLIRSGAAVSVDHLVAAALYYEKELLMAMLNGLQPRSEKTLSTVLSSLKKALAEGQGSSDVKTENMEYLQKLMTK